MSLDSPKTADQLPTLYFESPVLSSISLSGTNAIVKTNVNQRILCGSASGAKYHAPNSAGKWCAKAVTTVAEYRQRLRGQGGQEYK
jgi:hypothetical protein